jgi:hypothetical protein
MRLDGRDEKVALRRRALRLLEPAARILEGERAHEGVTREEHDARAVRLRAVAGAREEEGAAEGGEAPQAGRSTMGAGRQLACTASATSWRVAAGSSSR